MALGTEAAAFLDALSEPTLVLDESGTVEHLNRAATAQLGADLLGRPLSSAHAGDPDALETYLRRCLGSRQPLIGTFVQKEHGSAEKFHCRGSLIHTGDRRLILLRLSRAGDERFAALTRKVAELNDQVRERQRAQAVLEESLRERELLLRELQHRVKNNMHMLAGILIGAEREAASPEAKAALKDVSQRFSAVSAIQQLLYTSSSLATVGAQEFVSTLIRSARGVAATDVETEVRTDRVDLPIDAAIPLALVANELLTNALKYGMPPSGSAKLCVEFSLTDDQITLVVADNGPGFELAAWRKRASGLGLVTGLVRQLGGRFTVENASGARCVVSVPTPGNRTKVVA